MALGFGLPTYFSYLGSSLGYIGSCFGLSSSLGSTHAAHFGSNLISCHWDRGAGIKVRTKWGIYTKNFHFTKKCRGFILDGLVFLEKALGLLAMSSLMWSFGYLSPIFICTNLNEGTISVCMHAIVRLETLRVRI